MRRKSRFLRFIAFFVISEEEKKITKNLVKISKSGGKTKKNPEIAAKKLTINAIAFFLSFLRSAMRFLVFKPDV